MKLSSISCAVLLTGNLVDDERFRENIVCEREREREEEYFVLGNVGKMMHKIKNYINETTRHCDS